MNLSRLKKQLKRHEGFRKHPYKDTEGISTVGYGRNLDAVGISRAEARVLLENDIATAEAECFKRLPFFQDLDDIRQGVMVNMMFNLGWGKLKGFKLMLAALEDGDFELAAAEALDSRWHRQVKGRAVELEEQMKKGVTE